jgi:aryl-alcohol dehydrogenase-like predicted oxidoreductase
MTNRYELVPGYSISRIINGCWQLSEGHSLQSPLDFKDVMRAFHMLVEQGFTTFDCADIYTGVEEFIGKFVKELKRSGTDDTIQIHTKYVPDINLLSAVDYAYTEKIIDRSLTRLNREVLDVVQFHWWDYDTPGCLETAGHLSRLREKGKIRHIGVTNFDTEHFSEMVEAGIPVASFQTQYSMFDRRPEKKLRDYCQKKGVALLCYGTLSGGFLSERWLGKTNRQPETRSQVKYSQVIEDTLGWDGFQELLILLADIAQKYGATISNVATQYILNQPDVGAAIVGVRNSRHTAANAQTFTFTLDATDMKTIRSYLDKYPILEGEPFELERTPGCKYRNIMKMNLNEDD